MSSFRTFLYALVVVALAACGGGGVSSTSSAGSSSVGVLPPTASDSDQRDPNGSSVAFEKTTLWVGYNGPQIDVFSTDGNGAVTPQWSLGYISWTPTATSIPAIVDIAIAPDGTQWILENRDFALGGPGWRLFAIARGSKTPEYVNGDDVHSPFGLGLAGDGVMVGLTGPNGPPIIATYPYAVSNAPAMRVFQGTSSMGGFAEGNDGNLYVGRPDGYDVYRPDSTGCCPIRSITLGRSPGAFAVGPNNSVYVMDVTGNNESAVMYVNVYAPGKATLARRIGPLPAEVGGFATRVIAVDAVNRLYVATKGKFYRFGPNANGAATPQRVMTDPETSRRPVTMAIGPGLTRGGRHTSGGQ
jgi:hypothetical protein